MDMMTVQCEGSAAEMRYLSNMTELELEEMHVHELSVQDLELSAVGAGVGGGFKSTDELRVMNYKDAMNSEDAEAWKSEIKCEKDRFDKFGALTPVKMNEVPKGSKIMTTTWTMKKKASGKLRGRLNARGYKQIDGMHYVAESIVAPVTNPTSVRIFLTLMAMNPEWVAIVIDVEGAFLQGSLWIEKSYIFGFKVDLRSTSMTMWY